MDTSKNIIKMLLNRIKTKLILLLIPLAFILGLVMAFSGSGSSSSGSGSGGYNTAEGVVSYESLNLSNSDKEILYKITYAERGDGNQEQQEYVVSVILNRVLSSDYPNTVHGVVFQSGQFQPTRNGAYEKATPTQTTKDAVNNVIKTGDKSQCAIGFMTPESYYNQGWLQNGLSDGSWIYLFNDIDESHNNAGDNLSHNFFTKKSTQEELAQYAASSTVNMSVSGGTVVQSAVKIHKQVRESGKYSYDKSYNKQVPVNPPHIDCSSFVSWVMYESGFNQFKGGQKGSSDFASNPWRMGSCIKRKC